VLVADDEIPMCVLTEAIIRKRVGCQVSVAHDGQGVLDSLASEAADVLVADMVMPGIQGLELVAAVQRNWPHTDIIVVTGYSEDFPYVKVIRAGAKDFLAKPFQAEELEAKLLRIFRERDLRDAQIVAESKYRSLFELNTNGMVFLDDKTRTVLDANAAFCRLCGQNLEAISRKPLADLLDPFERGRFEQGLALCSRSDQGTLGTWCWCDRMGKKRLPTSASRSSPWGRTASRASGSKIRPRNANSRTIWLRPLRWMTLRAS
jgi:DNA-binding response OmpR family regulator